jgi:hypothetical protein
VRRALVFTVALALSACAPPVAPAVDDAARRALEDASLARLRASAADWPKSPNYEIRFNALDPGAAAAEGEALQFNPDDDYFGLPRTGAYELVAGYCSGCHSIKLVMQQEASRTRWAELLTLMVETHGMPKPDGEHEAAILDYLASTFGDG